ncbi:unnamed protein product [Calypogeia fissa]
MAVLQQIGLGIVPSTQAGFVTKGSSSSKNWTNGGIIRRNLQQQQQQQRSTWRGCRCQVGVGLHEVVEGLQNLHHGLVLGVGVGLPCQVMDCGDVVYRSTLPKQGLILTTPGVLLSLLVATYLWAQPGVAPGFWDMFVLAKLEQFLRPSYKKDDFTLGKKLGEGAFGTVYRATFSNKQSGKNQNLVVKKALQYGAVEVWMNERVRRACSGSCADFISGFRENLGKGKDEFWLVWRYEGDATLDALMTDKSFPYNVEKLLFGEVTELPKGPERENRIIRTLIRQILKCVRSLHATGIIHRDIKPQNIIFSQEKKVFKIIDLGAAADLRVGINYVPNEFLLDPRYAAPEQYIMSTQTPSAPPPAVATALSPVLWQMNVPDRFDVYSAGLIFLQLAFPNLRNDSALITFNRQLKRCDYNLAAWRENSEPRASNEMKRGFEILDMDGGVGWELLQSMIRFKGRRRLSAQQALAHPYFVRDGLLGTTLLQKVRLQLLRASFQDTGEAFAWIGNLMAKSGTKDVGGFTEADMQKLRKREPKQKATFQRNALAAALRLQRKATRSIGSDLGTGEGSDEARKRKNIWWNRWESKGET